MRRSQRRRLLNWFSLAALAFVIYLVAFSRNEDLRHPTGIASVQKQVK